MFDLSARARGGFACMNGAAQPARTRCGQAGMHEWSAHKSDRLSDLWLDQPMRGCSSVHDGHIRFNAKRFVLSAGLVRRVHIQGERSLLSICNCLEARLRSAEPVRLLVNRQLLIACCSRARSSWRLFGM